MNRIRKLILVVSMAALAVTALAVPASAAPGKGVIGVINGIPGVRVDICINGNEVRSRVKYGGRTFKIVFEGTKVVKVFRADPRTCKGTQLGKKTLAVGAGDDYTVVFNKIAPKAVMFDNTGLGVIAQGEPPSTGVALAWRHAADLGNASLKILMENPIAPSADPVWVEGDESTTTGTVPAPLRYGMLATRPDSTTVLAGPILPLLENGKRFEYYLLGVKKKNAKVIVWTRSITDPAP